MATEPLTAGFDSVAAETDKVVVAAPTATQRIEVIEGELSVGVAAKATVHFDTGDNADDRVLGGHLSAGGGSAAVRNRVLGPPGVGLFYTSDSAVAQTLWLRFRIVNI